MVTTEELNEQARKIAFLRAHESNAHQAKKVISDELEACEARMIEMLTESNLKTYKSEAGTATVVARSSVKLPQSPEDIAALAEYARSRHRYDQLFKPNSQSLNSFWREEFEEAQAKGASDYNMPGVGGVTLNLSLSFTKHK